MTVTKQSNSQLLMSGQATSHRLAVIVHRTSEFQVPAIQEDHQHFTLNVVSDDSVNMVRRTIIKIAQASQMKVEKRKR